MIALLSPVLAAGMVSTDINGVPPSAILTSSTSICQAGCLPLPVALPGILEAVDRISAPEAITEDTPTAEAHRSARVILIGANAIREISVPASSVEDFEGDIEIHWDGPVRSVVLVCSGRTGDASIYRESRSADPVESRLVNGASAQDLSEDLQWLLQ